MVLACFVGLRTCLETGLEFLTVVVLEVVDFEGLTLDVVAFEGTTLTGFVLGLDGVALEGVVLGLGDVFLGVVGCGFFGNAPCPDTADLVGLVLVVAGLEGFFLLSVTAFVFWEVLC